MRFPWPGDTVDQETLWLMLRFATTMQPGWQPPELFVYTRDDDGTFIDWDMLDFNVLLKKKGSLKTLQHNVQQLWDAMPEAARMMYCAACMLTAVLYAESAVETADEKTEIPDEALDEITDHTEALRLAICRMVATHVVPRIPDAEERAAYARTYERYIAGEAGSPEEAGLAKLPTAPVPRERVVDLTHHDNKDDNPPAK
jgi:hypothetical protein